MKLLYARMKSPFSNALTAILKRNNYSVDAVYNGEDALDYILSDEAAYGAVILDIMMPKRDGLAVLKEIRRKGKSVPVLILTAKTEIDDKKVSISARTSKLYGRQKSLRFPRLFERSLHLPRFFAGKHSHKRFRAYSRFRSYNYSWLACQPRIIRISVLRA